MRNPALILLILLSLACAQTGDLGSSNESETTYTGSDVVLDNPQVRSVQLYPGQSETALPVAELGRGLQFRLAFDLVETTSRPLTAYFYHADRDWNRDLSAGEFLRAFHQDDILDYRSSMATVVPYIHYEYVFPNRSIVFKLSGNYILRVSEQGREEEALFERRFFLSEQSTPLEMRMDQVLLAGRRSTSVQPYVRFQAPNANSSSFDYAVCFVRNSELNSSRCVDQPTMDILPDISFYLQPEDSFEPTPSKFFIDVSDLRTGGRVERVNQQVVPWQIELEPDYARLPGTQLAPFINGKTVIRGANKYVTEPDYNAEYVRVVFRLKTPDGVRAQGDVVLVGSFSNWEYYSDNTMRWNELEKWYEASILLKQGHYEYSYLSNDPRLSGMLQGGLPQLKNLFTSFVYYDDVFAQTDRLIAVQGVVVE